VQYSHYDVLPSVRTEQVQADLTRRETGVAEEVTQPKNQEEHNFLDAIMATRPMQYVHSYLLQKVVHCCRHPSLPVLRVSSAHLRSMIYVVFWSFTTLQAAWRG